MSVIVKGMKIPNNCYFCPFCDYVSARCNAVKGNPYTPENRYDQRPVWCPLVVAPEWISVEERLPEEGTAVSIVWVNHSPVIYYQDIKDKPQTATGVYYRGEWYWWSAVVQDYLAEYGKWEPDKMDVAIEVTHWMPIPEPPKETEE